MYNLRNIPPLIEAWLGEYNAEETTDERRVEIERMISDAEYLIEEKCNALASWVSSMKGEEVFLGEEIKRLQDRKAALVNQRDRTRNFIKYLLNGAKLKTELYTFYYMQKDSVVADINIIPEEFKRVIIEPKLAEIGKRLKAGEAIAGAHFEQGELSLVIR